jgi:hypothetical protein
VIGTGILRRWGRLCLEERKALPSAPSPTLGPPDDLILISHSTATLRLENEEPPPFSFFSFLFFSSFSTAPCLKQEMSRPKRIALTLSGTLRPDMKGSEVDQIESERPHKPAWALLQRHRRPVPGGPANAFRNEAQSLWSSIMAQYMDLEGIRR